MYQKYRNDLLSNLKSPYLEHKAVQHQELGSQNETLFTDYIYSKPKSKAIIHLSGLHGIEGYLGSLIQQQLLRFLSTVSEPDFQIVIVHAVNPYGMSWCRRTNKNNVDLNRNSLKIHDIPNPYFEKFSSLLNTNADLEMLFEIPDFFIGLCTIGIRKTIQSIACGQSEFPHSIFYSGQQLQPELVSLKENLSKIIAPDCEVFMIDVHSGLGKFAQETLIVDGIEPEKTDLKIREIYQAKTSVPGNQMKSYRAQGTLNNLFNDLWNHEKLHYVCQEFGTKPALTVLKALMKDNYLHELQFDISQQEKMEIWSSNSRSMLNSFFPDNKFWREQCVETGLYRFKQLLDYLSKN